MDTVEEAVGKTLRDENAAGVAVQGGERFWVFEYSIARQPQRRQELFAQSRNSKRHEDHTQEGPRL